MDKRSWSQLGPLAVSLLLIWAAMAPKGAAESLDEDRCKRLAMERQALLVLGIDKYFEKGPKWAEANLTVADFNLVKRYLDVYEQLKFRCEKDVDILGNDNLFAPDGTILNGRPPPLPARRPEIPNEAIATPPLPESLESVRGAASGGAAATIEIGPAQVAPAQ